MPLSEAMKDEIKRLEARLKELDAQIRETEKRIPAHSIKPPVMEDLFDLEDEREAILKELARNVNNS